MKKARILLSKIFTIIAILFLAFTIACSEGTDETTIPTTPTEETQPAPVQAPDEPIPSLLEYRTKARLGNFGPHFSEWLRTHGYSFPNGGFGGFRSNVAPVTNKPIVIFVHGNSSSANGATGDPLGWYNTYKYLREKGWNNSELYAVSFGYDLVTLAWANDHRSSNTNTVKNFINAVYQYTGRKVTVIAHSLGTTVTRKAMVDGNLYSKVATYISISGAHHGLLTCGSIVGLAYLCVAALPTCSARSGLCLPPKYHYLSSSTAYFLGRLNSSSYGDNEMRYKSTRTYTITSTVDELAAGRTTYTGYLKGAYKSKTYYTAPYGHFGCKDLTSLVQYQMIMNTY